MKLFNREKYESCSKLEILTSVKVDFATDVANLIINHAHENKYMKWWQSSLRCCYQVITRSGSNSSADNKFDLSACKTFLSGHQLEQNVEFIIVKCEGYLNIFKEYSTEIYANAHAIVREKESVKKRLSSSYDSSKISVLMMGIDSISRLNLIRSMPETYNHLESTGWYELRGYNKMADNTFPNLMAILTGYNTSTAYELCNPKAVGKLDGCNFVWKDFQKAGYATAFAEDEISINTFNYQKNGFVESPTDYYLRPFGIAAEKNIPVKLEHALILCLGHQHYADHVYQYMLDFATKFKNDSSFGLFWTNSFSHDELSMASKMDQRMKFYLDQLEQLGILETSIVIFFSDHGMRFGPIRNVFIGWLEERLPYFYIWLPKSFQLAYPEFAENLRINRDRLTSPYDVYVTLKHILKLPDDYTFDDAEFSAFSCPACQSLFTEVPIERSCSDAGVEKVWCTCTDFEETQLSDIVYKAVNYAIDVMNKELEIQPRCTKLKLKQISSARKSTRQRITDYLINFNVSPSDAQLEVTVRHANDSFSTIGSASRLNKYGNQSWCISDSELRKYCFCV